MFPSVIFPLFSCHYCVCLFLLWILAKFPTLFSVPGRSFRETRTGTSASSSLWACPTLVPPVRPSTTRDSSIRARLVYVVPTVLHQYRFRWFVLTWLKITCWIPSPNVLQASVSVCMKKRFSFTSSIGLKLYSLQWFVFCLSCTTNLTDDGCL